MTDGRNLINGAWVGSGTSLPSFAPLLNANTENKFAQATATDIDAAVDAAADAARAFGTMEGARRAEFLRCVADCIDTRGDQITLTCGAETALPAARLEAERGRTINQLRLFADLIEQPDWQDWRHVEAMPDRTPTPRPDLRLRQRSLGPIAIFGASNFPLAFSVAGGDTASALAAGCPVVVKAHPNHPGTCEIIADAFLEAIGKCDMPAGVFNCFNCSNEMAGRLLLHPALAAASFTGSQKIGRLLLDLAASRPQPIPFFAEMSSINPVFVLPDKLASEAKTVGANWTGSLTLGAGQFCTNPGVLVGIASAGFDRLLASAGTALADAAQHTMLAPHIAQAFRDDVAKLAEKTELVAGNDNGAAEGCVVNAAIYKTDAKQWLADPQLAEEVFGPAGLAVSCNDEQQFIDVAASLNGQLTATLQLTENDEDLAQKLVPLLEDHAGRLVCNSFPTGVEVCDAMMHGGPYPASSNPAHTSVGTLAIRRFLRPVCYQGFPASLAPKAVA